MSHLTDVRLRVNNLEDAGVAAEVLGGEFMEGQTQHGWYGRMVGDSAEGRQVARERGTQNLGKCEHAIRLKGHRAGDYEIGLVKAQDGKGFDLLYDSWGPGQKLTQAFGQNLDRFRHEYAIAGAKRKVREKLAMKGFKVASREALPSGWTRLRVQAR